MLGGVSENIYSTDAYAREAEATVIDVDPDARAILLERTVFYPGGGGQPADEGELVGESGGTWRVTGAKKRGDDIWHTIADGAELPAVDTSVVARLDWDRRHGLMRTHSALHVLCGVVWRDHQASVTGGNMEPLSGRMDFEFETMSGELVGDIERRVNEEIAADREIRVAILPREEAFAIPDLIRTKINLLPEGITEVRTVEIVGLDLQADGGTHVAHTGEIGRVSVTGYESKGRINKRIRIEVTD
jgi:misacylated tRNA(Ala) deacylase